MSMSNTSTSGSSVPDASNSSDKMICQLLPTAGCHKAAFPVPLEVPLGLALGVLLVVAL